MNITINKSIVNSINHTLLEDHQKFLKSIYLKYGDIGEFTLEYLKEKYKIDNILVVPNSNRKSKKTIRKLTELEPRYRCMARCWGGEESVKYDYNTNTWTCGYQCKRKKQSGLDYCGIHQNEIDNGYLTHGRIDGEVPHPHYDKYKIKIEIKNSMIKDNLNLSNP